MKISHFTYGPSYCQKIKSAAILFAFIATFSACDKTPELILPRENKLVILAEITSGDSAHIVLTASKVAGSGDNIVFEKVNDATVNITGQDGSSIRLNPNTSTDFTDVPGAIYSNPKIFLSNTDYTIDATHPLYGTVNATTHIPSPFMVSNITSEESSIQNRDVLKFNFSINDVAGKNDYYLFEAVKQIVRISHYFYWQGVKYDYDTQAGKDLFESLEDEDEDVTLLTDTIPTGKYLRIQSFTTDNNTDNKIIGPIDSSFNRIFLKDSTFNGQVYSTSISVLMDNFTAINPAEKGIVLIQVKSVDKPLYDYLLQNEKYKSDFGRMPVGQLTSPSGNIHNGFGIFGGSFKREWKFFYDDLE